MKIKEIPNIKDIPKKGDEFNISAFLQSKGFDLEAEMEGPFNTKETPLIAIINDKKLGKDEKTNIVSFLIKQGVNILERDKANHSLLLWAIMKKLPVADEIYQAGGRLNVTDFDFVKLYKDRDITAYLDVTFVEQIMKHLSPSAENEFIKKYGKKIFDIALQEKKTSLMKKLIPFLTQDNLHEIIKHQIYHAVLFESALESGNLAMLEELARQGINVPQKLGDGSSPLQIALIQHANKPEIFDFLARNGADINQFLNAPFPNPQNLPNPWVYASVVIDNPKLVLCHLLKNNFEKYHDNIFTPLAYSILNSKYENILFLTKGKMNEPNFLGINIGSYVLFMPADQMSNMFDFLKKNGLNLDGFDVYGNTLLNLAISLKKDTTFAAVRALINSGADVNKPDNRGNTPLLLAIKSTNLLIVTSLLSAGADIFKMDINGDLPIEIAERSATPEIKKTIKSATEEQIGKHLELLLNKGDIEMTKKIILKTYGSGYLDIPNREHWSHSEQVFKFIHDTCQSQNDYFKNLSDSFVEARKTEDDVAKFMKNILSDNVNSLAFEKYLSMHHKELYDAFRTQKYRLTILECDRLGNAGDRQGATTLVARRGLDSKIMIKMLSTWSPQHIPIFMENAFGPNWVDPLYNLCKEDPNIFEVLIKSGFSFSTTDKAKQSIFHHAIIDNNITVIKQLFEHQESLKKNIMNIDYVVCPVRLAMANSANSIFEFLLEKGANPIYGCNMSQPNLSECTRHGNQKFILNKYQELLTSKEKKASGDVSENAALPLSTTQTSPIEKSVTTEMRTRAQRLGHILGITKMSYSRQNATSDAQQEYSINLEGAQREYGYRWVSELLTQHCEEENKVSMELKSCSEAYQATLEVVNQEKDRQTYYSRYQAGHPVTIPLSWHGHAINITLQNGWLSYTNRGAGGDQQHGTKIYQIKPGVDIEKFIMDITINSSKAASLDFCSPTESTNYFFNSMKYAVDLDNPFDELPQKGQKRGNCTVANTKGALEGMLYISNLNEYLKTHSLEELREYRPLLRQQARAIYKEHTNFMRDLELDALIEEIRVDVNKNQNVDFYYDLMVSFIREHHDFDKKNGAQGLRILKIFNELPEKFQSKIIQAVPEFISLKEAFIEKHKDRIKNTPILTMSKLRQQSSKAPLVSSVDTPRVDETIKPKH